jgi:hypothetical protein
MRRGGAQLKKTLIAKCIDAKRLSVSRGAQRWGTAMSKIASVMLAVTMAASASLLPAPARAENGQIAAGVVGGLIGGALLGGALAARPAPLPPPVYYAPEPVYVEEPACRIIHERFWDGYSWQIRRVQVCN